MKRKTNRILALLLACALLAAAAPAALADGNMTVYVTVSVRGSIPVGTDGTLMAAVPVSLAPGADIGDALSAAHESACPGGFARSGDSLTRLWNDESMAFGYWRSDAAASGLGDAVADGDTVTAFIYSDTTGWSDLYAHFDRAEATAAAGGAISLTLLGASWSGETPLAGADVGTLDADGTLTRLGTTDADGVCSLVFASAGDYLLSASAGAGAVITAPVCRLRVLGDDGARALIDAAAAALSVPDTASADLSLPLTGADGVVIAWASSSDALTADGHVFRGDSDASAVLTATVGMSGTDYTAQRQFTVTVPAADPGDAAAAQADMDAVKAALTFEAIRGLNEKPYAVASDLVLPAAAQNGPAGVVFGADAAFSITWTSANAAVAGDGRVTQGSSPASGALTAAIHHTGGLVRDETVSFPITVLDWNSYFYNGVYYGLPLGSVVARNIAAGWLATMDTANWPWVVADMAAANAAGIYGTETTYDAGWTPTVTPVRCELTAEAEQAYVDHAVAALAADGVSASDMAKYIIGLTALGYDARHITTAQRTALNAAAALAAAGADETSIYALPYEAIALRAFGDEYAAETAALIDKITAAAFSTGGWGYSYGGADYFDADATAAALLALAPYYGAGEYDGPEEAADAAVLALGSELAIDADGVVTSWGSRSVESTALLVTAFAAYGWDTESVFGTDLAAGVLSMADETGSAFLSLDWSSGGYGPNAMATEQGFRALIASIAMSDSGSAYILYDFPTPTTPAEATWAAHCPVTVSTVPADAAVIVTGADGPVAPVGEGSYDLPAGEYTVSVSREGYNGRSVSVSVSAAEDAAHTPKSVPVSLTAAQSSSGSITVTVHVKMHSAADCGGAWTYKANAASYYDAASGTYTLPAGATAFDALDATGVSYVEKGYGYISSVNGVGEGDHGSRSGWLFMVNGRASETGSRRYTLSGGDTVVWFYTDDYVNDYGSENWSSDTGSAPAAAPAPVQEEAAAYTDVAEKAWYAAPVAYCSAKGLMQGVGGDRFDPEGDFSRAMLAAVLYRLSGAPAPESAAEVFADVASGSWYADAVGWAYARDIAVGAGEGLFLPDRPITRAEAAVMLYRCAAAAELIGEESGPAPFTDRDLIPDWALAAMDWAYANGLFIGRDDGSVDPLALITRAEAAAVVMRYCENITA